MEALFARILNMSITGTVVISFVLLARLGLRKAPRVFSYVLWAAVLFRLLCPVSITVDFSLFHLAEIPVTEVSGNTTAVEFLTEELVYPREDWKEIPDAAPAAEPESEVVLPVLWMLGMGLMAMWGLWSMGKLKGRLVEAAPIGDGVWECDGLDTAFVTGLLRPRIWLPSGLAEQEREFVLLHEKHHVKRLDHVWKLAAFGALCIHWFNPAVWVAFWLAQKDMEMSCDEAVLKHLEQDARCDYSQTLLRVSSGRRRMAAMPLAFGEGNVKERVVHVLNWKKPRMWVRIVCGVACGALLVACGGNPAVETALPEDTPAREETKTREELEQEQAELEERLREAEERYRQELEKSTYTVDVELAEYANISLKLPQGWIYEKVEPEMETSARGIRFWPSEFPDMQIELCWHPEGFGVCGTGLEEKELELDNGEMAHLGFYDGSDCMSFCAYGRNYAAVNVSTVDKWEEYGDTILGILKSVDLNRGVISEERAIALIRDWVQEDWTLYRSEFDVDEGVWTFRFYEDYSGDAVDVICVDHEGNCWRHGDISHEEHHDGHHHD